MPWVILSLLVFVWGLPQMKAFLNGLSNPQLPIPMLDHAVVRAPPVVPTPKPEEAVFAFNWLSATGTSLLLAGHHLGPAARRRPGAARARSSGARSGACACRC